MFQSVILVLMVGVAHLIGKNLLSFIENDNLATMLNGIFKCCLLFFFLTYMVRNKFIERLAFSFKKINTPILITSILGIISISYFPLPEFSFFDQDTLAHFVSDILESQPDIFIFVYLVLIAPVFEEIVFRGLILRGLSETYSPIVAILISSVLFTILHVSLIGTFLFGLFIGWVYYQTKNLLYCILMHMAVNLIAFGMRLAVFEKYTTIESLNGFLESNNLFVGAALLIVFFVSLYYLSLTLKKYEQ